jgi:hypothetical protein
MTRNVELIVSVELTLPGHTGDEKSDHSKRCSDPAAHCRRRWRQGEDAVEDDQPVDLLVVVHLSAPRNRAGQG